MVMCFVVIIIIIKYFGNSTDTTVRPPGHGSGRLHWDRGGLRVFIVVDSRARADHKIIKKKVNKK